MTKKEKALELIRRDKAWANPRNLAGRPKKGKRAAKPVTLPSLKCLETKNAN